MKCPKCGGDKGGVIDSRPSTLDSIRRRRFCECGHRWTTYETADAPAVVGQMKLSSSIKPACGGELGMKIVPPHGNAIRRGAFSVTLVSHEIRIALNRVSSLYEK